MNKHTFVQIGNVTQFVNSGDEVNVYGHIYIAQDHGDNLTLVYDRPAEQENKPASKFCVDDIVLAGEMKAVSKIVEIKPDGVYMIHPEGLNMTFEVKEEDLTLHKRKSPPLFKVDDTVFLQGFMCVVTEVHANELYTVRTVGTNDIYTKKESELIIHRRPK
jgi:hypothetical protein